MAPLTSASLMAVPTCSVCLPAASSPLWCWVSGEGPCAACHEASVRRAGGHSGGRGHLHFSSICGTVCLNKGEQIWYAALILTWKETNLYGDYN